MLDRNKANRFANVAQSVDIPRSQIPMKWKFSTTGNVGKLLPLCPPIEVIPGDEWSIDSSVLARLQTPLNPTMDSMYIDTFWFFVPMRLLWSHWKQFMGESDVAGYDNVAQYTIPRTVFQTDGPTSSLLGTLADKFGLPVYNGDYDSPAPITQLSVNALPFRAYNLIWNNFFRDQNVQNPVFVQTGDTDPGGYDILPVNKFHDYFTSSLPYVQKGPDVLLPISGLAPVFTGDSSVYGNYQGEFNPILFQTSQMPSNGLGFLGLSDENTPDSTILEGVMSPSGTIEVDARVRPINLYADLNSVNNATIVQLRQAFAVQRLYETFALGGSRYFEMLRSVFGVVAPEARLQLPEYLGGARQKINMTQVIQTVGTDSNPLGSTGAFSLTTLHNKDFDKTFVEHGYIIGLYAIRNINSYEQGINRLWLRRDMLDFYFPELANVGEQPVFAHELYYQDSDFDKGLEGDVFGYQERYAEYRYIPSVIAGEFRHGAPYSLDTYKYTDWYANAPVLSDSWLRSSSSNVDRTLTVPSSTADNFWLDAMFNAVTRRKMPLFGGHSLQSWG